MDDNCQVCGFPRILGCQYCGLLYDCILCAAKLPFSVRADGRILTCKRCLFEKKGIDTKKNELYKMDLKYVIN